MRTQTGSAFIVDLNKIDTLRAPQRKRIMSFARTLWRKQVLEQKNRSIFGTEEVHGFPTEQKEVFDIVCRLIAARGQVWDFDKNSLKSTQRLEYCFKNIAITLERESEKITDSETMHWAHARVRESGELVFSAKLFYKKASRISGKNLSGKVFLCSRESAWEKTLREEWDIYWKEQLSDLKMFEKMPFLASIDRKRSSKAPS